MFTITTSDFQRVAISGLGALAVSAVCVFGAVAPAKAATVDTESAWAQSVQSRIAQQPLRRDARLEPSTLHAAVLAAHFTSDGDFAGATLARSSGDRAIDRDALKVASRMRYPRLPATMQGAARDVTLKLFYGDATRGVEAPIAKPVVEVAGARRDGVQVAAR